MSELQPILDTSGYYHELPRDIISGVYVNEQLQGRFAKKDDQEVYLNPENLIRMAAKFSFGENQPLGLNQQQLISPSGHRSMTIRKFETPIIIANMPYTVLRAKGTGLHPSRARNMKEPSSEGGDPIGFSGLRSALAEMQKANDHLAHDHRTNQFLGVIALDPDGMKQWLESNRHLFPSGYDPIIELEKIAREGDVPAITVQFTHSRLKDLSFSTPRDKQTYPYSEMHIQRERISLLQASIENAGGLEKFIKYEGIDQLPMSMRKPIEATLQYVQNHKTHPKRIPHRIVNGLTCIDAYSAGRQFAEYVAHEKPLPNGRIPFPYGGKAQDLSLGIFWNDFEESRDIDTTQIGLETFLTSFILDHLHLPQYANYIGKPWDKHKIHDYGLAAFRKRQEELRQQS